MTAYSLLWIAASLVAGFGVFQLAVGNIIGGLLIITVAVLNVVVVTALKRLRK